MVQNSQTNLFYKAVSVSKTVHHEIHGTLPVGVPLGIHHHVPLGIHLLDCCHGNVWDLGSHAWAGGLHALLYAST